MSNNNPQNSHTQSGTSQGTAEKSKKPRRQAGSVQIDMPTVMTMTTQIIDRMESGATIKMDDIVNEIVEKTQMSVNPVRTIVSASLRTHSDVEVIRGKGGGIFKGHKERTEDTRERCPHCDQVIRKGRPRSREDGAEASANASENDENASDEGDTNDEVEAEEENDTAPRQQASKQNGSGNKNKNKNKKKQQGRSQSRA